MDPSRDGSKLPPPVRGRARGRTSAFLAASSAAAAEGRSTFSDQGVAAATPAAGSSSLPPVGVPVPIELLQSHRQMQDLSIEKKDPIKPKYTYRFTRPCHVLTNKQTPPAKASNTFNMISNCFQVTVADSWAVHQYRVSFEPPLEEDQTMQRKGLFKKVVPELAQPACLFDGLMLFTTLELTQCPTTLTTTDKFTNEQVQITIDCHKVVDKKEAACFQIYNIFVRKIQEFCNFAQIGRKFFDPNLKKEMQGSNVEVWPGFATSLRYFENSLLLNVELVHKVIRTNTVYHQIRDKQMQMKTLQTSDLHNRIAEEIEGCIVMTKYNQRTYPVQKILWEEKVTDTFPLKDGTTKTYVAYFKEKYGITLKHLDQPLLLVGIKEKNLRRGMLDTVKLAPEICYATGLTDAMRSDWNFMKSLGNITHVLPDKRVGSSMDFIKRLTSNEMIKAEMSKWKIQLDQALVPVVGKQLQPEYIFQGTSKFSYDQFSRAANFRVPLHEPKSVNNWYVLVSDRDKKDFLEFQNQLQQVGRAMKIQFQNPIIRSVNRPIGSEYLDAIDKVIQDARGKVDLIFMVLPNTKPTQLYSIIKQKLTKDYAIPSQCCLVRNLKKGLSVASKIAVQVCCKVGGVPWIIRNPFTKDAVCVIGFDVYHSGSIGGTSYGAIVATTNHDLSKTCSFVKQHMHRFEISTDMGQQIKNCLLEYKKVNARLPNKIFFYRDGVGEGQVEHVLEIELESAQEQIKQLYSSENIENPKLTYVIVTKRINTRFMVVKGRNEYGNPPPGTIVDDVVTLHYRYDFFLVSQSGTQGSISPTNYNVVHDDNAMEPFRMQTFTFKLCHNYYNWNGTLSVPSVCQNAHKLAYITGEAIKGGCKESLRHLPYYL